MISTTNLSLSESDACFYDDLNDCLKEWVGETVTKTMNARLRGLEQ